MDEAIPEMIEYRVAVVQPDSRKILAINASIGYRLLRCSIPQRTRATAQLQKVIRADWALHVLILDFLPSRFGNARCAVAELLFPEDASALRPVSLDQISSSEISEQQRSALNSLLSESSSSPLFRIGWIDEAIAWLQSEIRCRIASKRDIEQLNAGGAFSLLRFRMEDDRYYWLKATGVPNLHEYSITNYLSRLATPCVPAIIGIRPEWNAWLMSGEGTSIFALLKSARHAFPLLEDAVNSLALLQMATIDRSPDLIDAGAFDQRLPVLEQQSAELFDYLEEAMSLQISKKAPRLGVERLREIRISLEEVCQRTSDLDIPATIVHGDLNPGNIVSGSRCQFIDWSEAYVGHPLVSLQHLLMLNPAEDLEQRELLNGILKNQYRRKWGEICSAKDFDEAFVYMPFLAAASALYGRGSWLTSSERNNPQRQSYSRTLARYMDCAMKKLQSREVLCH